MPIEQAFIVCMRVEDLADPVDGSTRTACVECGCDLWISLESRKVAAEKKAMPLCGPCGLRLAKEEPTMITEIGDPSVGQLSEIEQAIKDASVGSIDAEVEALVDEMPEGWEDMDGFELLKHSARASTSAMHNPQDDWGSMVIMEGYDGTSFPPVPLSKMLESGVPKEVIAKQLLPALAHASNAKRVMFALSAWTLDSEATGKMPELKGPISEHAERKEALVLIDVTAEGVVGMSTAYITRDGTNGPTLGEWIDAEKPERSDGLFVEALIPVLVLIKTIREGSGA